MHTKHFILTKQRRGHPVNTSAKMSNMFERNFLENWNVDTSMNTNKNPFSATQFREGCLQNRYCDFDHFWDYLILPWLFNCKLYLPCPCLSIICPDCMKENWESQLCKDEFLFGRMFAPILKFLIFQFPYFSIFWMHIYVVFLFFMLQAN